MTDEDWQLVDWAMHQIRDRRWGQPWIVSFEYGGVGGLWESVTDKETLRKQIPRLAGLVKNGQPGGKPPAPEARLSA